MSCDNSTLHVTRQVVLAGGLAGPLTERAFLVDTPGKVLRLIHALRECLAVSASNDRVAEVYACVCVRACTYMRSDLTHTHTHTHTRTANTYVHMHTNEYTYTTAFIGVQAAGEAVRQTKGRKAPASTCFRRDSRGS